MNMMIKSALLILLWSSTLFAGAYIIKPSSYSVDRTTERFSAIIKKKGFTLFAIIDHQANASSVGLKMKPSKVVIFGNPQGGTLLMNSDMRISLELPLKVAIYEDDQGVKMIYKKPESYTKTFKLEDSKLIKKITFGLDKLTDAAGR